MHRLLPLVLCWLACGSSPGCGKSDAPEVAPAAGRVLHNGKPVVKAHVFFAPESGERMATGYTNQEGRFRLGTFEVEDGAIVGKHRVSVQAHGPGKPVPPGQGSGLPGDMLPGDPIIPMKYFSPETSGLTRDVARGKNEFEIELAD